jgi:hypothetical protein
VGAGRHPDRPGRAVGAAAAANTAFGDEAHYLFAGMRQCQTLGLVWFGIRQDDGVLDQDWRIEDNQAAETALKLGISGLKPIHS